MSQRWYSQQEICLISTWANMPPAAEIILDRSWNRADTKKKAALEKENNSFCKKYQKCMKNKWTLHLHKSSFEAIIVITRIYFNKIR